MKFKHSSRSYSKFILKSASFLLIFLITFSQYSILDFEDSYSNQTLGNKGNELTNNENNTPQSALDTLRFENAPLVFDINEKGNLDGEGYWNIWYEGFWHSFYQMIYLSINDGEVIPFYNFLIVETLTNLTEFIYGDFTRQLVAESIIKYPGEDVYIKNQIKLYPDEEFFVMTFMIWSDTIDINKAELFFYNDLDIDESSTNDFADYDVSTELIYASDKTDHTSMGWISTYPITSWDLGFPDTIEANVFDDTLDQTITVSPTAQDISMVTKYQKNNLNANETWIIPLIYGFATSEAGIYATTVDVKDDFINDFSVLDFTANLTDNPSVNATILNGGQNELTRNVSVFRNGTYLQSQEIPLSPGEIGNVIFENLLLNSGEYNEITVTVNDTVNDYQPNNEISHTYLYQERFRINIKDLDGFDVEGLNVSLYHNVTQILIDSAFTDEFGNATFIDLPENNYVLEAYAPWVIENNQLIYEVNFTYPDVGEFLSLQTNLTTLILNIEDVEGNSVKNASIDISEDLNPGVIIWSGVTDQNGNVTFQFLNQTYDINVTYFDYETSLLLENITDLNLLGKIYYTHQVSLMNLTFHLKTNGLDLDEAKLEFYERIDSSSYGNFIGFSISDSIGNVSIRWSSLINYSIRVKYFNKYKPIGDNEDDALNFTNSPYNSYIFLEVNVSLEGKTPDEYSTEIILFNSLPISYTWKENIDIQFMFNVSGPDIEGGKWANETSIVIKNRFYDIIYEDIATEIPFQEGNYSFILNTSSGYFTSGNPETYTVNIVAQSSDFKDATLDTFFFNIYNITTDMDLHSSSETLYWKDNFTISANYFEKITRDPIIDGNLKVSWGSSLINYPMQNLGNGTYTIEINSSLGSPGNSVVNVQCFRENYNSDFMKFYLNVQEIPTTVNGSILFGSGHSQYVTTQNLTLEYDFIDSYRNISIPDISPMYQIINSDTDEQYTGYLTYNESGMYSFDPNSALLPIGTYHGLIDFSLENYVSSYASIQFDILPIPLSLILKGGSTNDANDFENSTQYSIERGENFYYEIEILDIYENPVQECNISYSLKMGEQIKEGYLQTDNEGHYFGSFSEFTEIGLYSLSLTVNKANHTVESYQFYIDVEYETPIGDIPLPYLLVGALMLLIAISAAVGYASIKRMRIPRYIKDLSKLEKILKNTNNILPERYPTRIEQLKEKYGNRWEQIDLQFPLQQQIDEIKNFINAYQEMTGKLFLKEEAKQFLDDLIIYSEDEIKRRLEAERIFGENLSKLMEIILNYIEVTSNQHGIDISDAKVVDDFDLEFGDDK